MTPYRDCVREAVALGDYPLADDPLVDRFAAEFHAHLRSTLSARELCVAADSALLALRRGQALNSAGAYVPIPRIGDSEYARLHAAVPAFLRAIVADCPEHADAGAQAADEFPRTHAEFVAARDYSSRYGEVLRAVEGRMPGLGMP